MNDHRAFYRCLVILIGTILACGLGAGMSSAQTYVCPPGYYFLAGYGCYPYGGYRVPPGYYYPPPYPYAVTAPPPVVYPAPSFGFGFEFGGHDHDHGHEDHGRHR